MMINIYGGNNLIAPVASSAIQNFYGDRGDEAADQPEDSEKTENTESVADEKPAQEPAELSDDEFYVSVYIPDIKVMRAYKILLGECTTARELAVVVGKMLADENCRNVDKHTVVKAAFIKSLLPFAKRLVSGGTIANIRAQINNMLASKYFFRLSSYSIGTLANRQIIYVAGLSDRDENTSDGSVESSPECDGADAYRYGQDTSAGICGQ